MKLADTRVLEALAERLAGSSPAPGTSFRFERKLSSSFDTGNGAFRVHHSSPMVRMAWRPSLERLNRLRPRGIPVIPGRAQRERTRIRIPPCLRVGDRFHHRRFRRYTAAHTSCRLRPGNRRCLAAPLARTACGRADRDTKRSWMPEAATECERPRVTRLAARLTENDSVGNVACSSDLCPEEIVRSS